MREFLGAMAVAVGMAMSQSASAECDMADPNCFPVREESPSSLQLTCNDPSCMARGTATAELVNVTKAVRLEGKVSTSLPDLRINARPATRGVAACPQATALVVSRFRGRAPDREVS